MESTIIEQCMACEGDRFKLVMLAVHRARALENGDAPSVEAGLDKYDVIALREIADKKVDMDDIDTSLRSSYDDVLMRMYGRHERQESYPDYQDQDRRDESFVPISLSEKKDLKGEG